MTVSIETRSAALQMLHEKAARVRRMLAHLSQWAGELADEAEGSPREEAENRETLDELHDEIEGVMARFGCDVIFEIHEESGDEK